jgi:hypothetical protein
MSSETPTLRPVTYKAIYIGPTNPRWATVEGGGKYVAYHYIQEAAEQLAQQLGELSAANAREAGLRAELDEKNKQLNERVK